MPATTLPTLRGGMGVVGASASAGEAGGIAPHRQQASLSDHTRRIFFMLGWAGSAFLLLLLLPLGRIRLLGIRSYGSILEPLRYHGKGLDGARDRAPRWSKGESPPFTLRATPPDTPHPATGWGAISLRLTLMEEAFDE